MDTNDYECVDPGELSRENLQKYLKTEPNCYYYSIHKCTNQIYNCSFYGINNDKGPYFNVLWM